MNGRALLLACLLTSTWGCGANGGSSARRQPDAGDDAAEDAGADAASDDAEAGAVVDGSDGSVSPACAALASKLGSALDQARKQSGGPGAVLAVTTPSCGRWVGASGESTKGVALQASDVFRVGSITKTFVATSVLTLVASGAVGLEDPLEKWLPGFPNGAAITLHQVLNHTSGIFNYTDDATFDQTVAQDPATVWTPQQLVDIAAGHPPYFAPGKGWQYSNTDYILLGMLLEKVTGQKAGKVLHADAIDKAALSFTTLAGYEPTAGTLAHGFSTTGADVSTLFDPSYAWTAGAMVASPGDLADWAVALYGGSILDAKTLGLMLQTVDTGAQGIHYGLGVFVWDPSVVGGTRGWGHPGDIDGYHSQMLYLPDKKTAIVAIVNSDAADPNGVTVAALKVLLP